MTKSTITRERAQQIFLGNGPEPSASEERELARMALAAMDSESGCLHLDYLQGHKDGLEWAAKLAEANHPETGDWLYDDPIELAKAIRKGPDMPPAQPVADSEPVIVVGDDGGDALSYRRLIQSFEPGTKLYRHAQPAPDREQIRNDHAEWSQSTFGNVGPIGPLKHLSKEALEAAADPSDLSEWADMQFLLWDAQRRAGITDKQITQAMIEKLAVNKQREWPAPKDGEPRLHIKTQPAPVIPDRSIFEKWWESQNGAPLDGWDSLRTTDGYCDDGIDWQFEAWNAAMLAAAPQEVKGE
ncbi:Eaa1 [Klebsiella pneumoniae]|nr:Eaa1 [Klebsiella pneumoniae]